MGRLLASALLLLAPGCFEYEETIFLQNDGSGHIAIRYAVSQLSGLVSLAGESDPFGLPTDPESILALFEGSGLKVVNLEIAQAGQETRVSFDLFFEDIRAFFDLVVIPNQHFEYDEDALGNWRIRRWFSELGNLQQKLEDRGWIGQLVLGSLKERKLTFRLESEIEILESDAPRWNLRQAEWVFPLIGIEEEISMRATLENPLSGLREGAVIGGVISGIVAAGGAVLLVRRYLRQHRRRPTSEGDAAVPT